MKPILYFIILVTINNLASAQFVKAIWIDGGFGRTSVSKHLGGLNINIHVQIPKGYIFSCSNVENNVSLWGNCRNCTQNLDFIGGKIFEISHLKSTFESGLSFASYRDKNNQKQTSIALPISVTGLINLRVICVGIKLYANLNPNQTYAMAALVMGFGLIGTSKKEYLNLGR